jgi:hypothetical protein
VKKLIVLILFLPLFIFTPKVSAHSGCCSSHGGVCGCGCCDGTPLSSTCAPYYPECSSGSQPQVQQNTVQAAPVYNPPTQAPVYVVPTHTPIFYTPTPYIIHKTIKKPTPKPTKKLKPTPKPKKKIVKKIKKKIKKTPTPTPKKNHKK